MSLELDTRQRAMLQEMGVRVWLPQATAPAPVVVAVAAQAPRPLVAAAVAVAAPSVALGPAAADPALEIQHRALVAVNTHAKAPKAPETRAPAVRQLADMATPDGIADGLADMDWPTLAQTIADCQACKLCTGRRAPVFGAAQCAPQADWLVVGEPPDDSEERAGSPMAEQAGQLLDNMLKAVGVSRQGAGDDRAAAAYVSNVVKCRPVVVRIPDAQELATCEHYLRREVALVQPKVILALGRFAAQSLLCASVPEVASIPLGKLRGQIYRYQGIPVVVSYHPNYLLRTQSDKARAWADWCLALTVIRAA